MIDEEERDEIIQLIRELAAHADELADKAYKADRDRIEAQKQYDLLSNALERSSYDISPCVACCNLVVCVPDGLPICDACAMVEAKRHNPP